MFWVITLWGCFYRHSRTLWTSGSHHHHCKQSLHQVMLPNYVGKNREGAFVAAYTSSCPVWSRDIERILSLFVSGFIWSHLNRTLFTRAEKADVGLPYLKGVQQNHSMSSGAVTYLFYIMLSTLMSWRVLFFSIVKCMAMTEHKWCINVIQFTNQAL